MSSQVDAAVTGRSHGHQGHGVGFNLGLIAVGVAVLALAAAYGIDGVSRTLRVSHNDSVVTRVVAGATLTIPAAWLSPRDNSGAGAGFAKEVDLTVAVPLGAKGKLTPVDLSIVPRSRVRPSAALLDGVYIHQFQQVQVSGPPGLVGKPMMSDGGYAGETVWYDPIHAAPFTAKCETPVVSGGPARCLRAIYAGSSVAVIYSFDARLLDNWQAFDQTLAPVLARIGALSADQPASGSTTTAVP